MGRIIKTILTISVITIVISPVITFAQPPQRRTHGDAITLDDVVVTAEQIQAYIEHHPRQVTMMTRDQIVEGCFSDLNQVLEAMPGVEVKKSGSGLGSRISIRGSGNSGKILVLINGRAANSTQYGSVDLDSIPLDMVSRVDVFKPPVPVWLGPGGTAGAVNITLSNINAKKDKEKKTTRIGIHAGSFGKVGGNVSRQVLLGDHQIRIAATGKHRYGRRTNSDRDNGSLSFQWNLPQKGRAQYDVNGRYYQSEHGSPGRTTNPTPNARQSYKKGALDLRAKGGWGESGEYELKTYLDVIRLRDDSEFGLVSSLNALTYGIKNETSWTGENSEWAIRLSGNMARDTIDHTLSGDHHREKGALGLQGDRRFGDISISLGARGDYTSDFGFQPALTWGASLPIGARSRAKINAGYGANVPSFGQLYQPSHGSIDQVRGNPDLEEEHVWSLSAGVSYDVAKDSTLEMTFFREEKDDPIVYYEGEDRISRPVNIDGAYRQGIETIVSWRFNPSATLDVSYIWQKSRNRENDQALTHTPKQKFTASLHWTLATKTRTVTTFSYVSQQFSDLDNTDLKRVDGYTTLDLKLIQPVSFKGCKLEAFVYFKNLLNEAYEVHHGYPDDGFRFTIGVNLDF